MKNIFVTLIVFLPALSWAADTPASLTRAVKIYCTDYAKRSLSDDFVQKRGGKCVATNPVIDPSTARRIHVAPLSAIRDIPVIEAFGQIKISCSETLFQPAQDFSLNVRFLAGPFNHGPCSVQDKTSFF